MLADPKSLGSNSIDLESMIMDVSMRQSLSRHTEAGMNHAHEPVEFSHLTLVNE